MRLKTWKFDAVAVNVLSKFNAVDAASAVWNNNAVVAANVSVTAVSGSKKLAEGPVRLF